MRNTDHREIKHKFHECRIAKNELLYLYIRKYETHINRSKNKFDLKTRTQINEESFWKIN